MAVSEAELAMVLTAKDQASRVVGRLSKTLGTAGLLAGGAVVAGLTAAAGAATALGAKAVLAAGDVAETVSKFEVTFGQASDSLQKDLSRFGLDVGRSRFQLVEMAADMGATVKAMGIQEDVASQLSGSLVRLAVDVGSFNNVQAPDVADRFTRALTGEFESLKALGIVINQTRLKQELANMGITENVNAVDQATKAQAIFNLLMESTRDAQGDAARTSQSFANQMVKVKAIVSDTVTEIGLRLLPVVTPLIQRFAELASDVGPQVVELFEAKIVPAIDSVISAIERIDFEQLLADFATFKEDVALVWEDIKTQFSVSLPEIQSNTESALNSIQIFWQEHGETIMAIVSLALRTIVAFVQGTLVLLSGIIAAILLLITGDWEGAWQKIKDTAIAFMQAVLAAVGMDLDEFVRIWRHNLTLAQMLMFTFDRFIQDWIRTTSHNLLRGGMQMIESLVRGIERKVNAIKARLRRKLREITALARRIFKFGSPSQVFEDIGAGLMSGLALGIERAAGRPLAAVSMATRGVTGGAIPGRAGMGAGITVVVQYSPVVSLADRTEAVNRLAPLIQAALRDEFARRG